MVALVVLMACEVFARAVLTSPSAQDPDPELGWSWRPGATIFNGREGGARLVISSLGLNDEELGPKVGRRVLVLGNSFTEALQVAREENFTSVAEGAELEGGQAPLDVVNLGRSAMGPAHYPIVLDRFARPLEADVAVVVEGAGDVSHLLGAATGARHDASGAVVDVHLVPEGKDRLKAAFGPVLDRSALAVYLMRRYKGVLLGWARGLGLDHEPSPEGPPRSRTEAELEEARGRLAFVLLRMKEMVPRLVLLDAPELAYDADRSVARADPSTSAVYRGAAKEAGIPYVDAGYEMMESYRSSARPLHGFPNVELGRGHLNEEGHRVIGALLAQAISP